VGIGAPYEKSSDSTSNTGAVYVYYGKDTRDNFESQTPVRVSVYNYRSTESSLTLQVHGDDIVNAVEGLTSFRTFGFSISGNVDVDNNQYKGVCLEWVWSL
jgi:hypothetical protein